MNIFKTISDTLAGLLKHHKADPVDKSDLLNLVDNNMVLLRLVSETFADNGDLFRFIQSDLLNGSNKANAGVRELYTNYVRLLSPTARRAESPLMLGSLAQAAGFALADNQKIRDSFDAVFKDGTDVGDITLEQMKLSHAAIFGFLNLSTMLGDFFCYLLGELAGHMGEQLRVPAYRVQVLKTSGSQVAAFVNDVMARGSQRDILSVVAAVRQAGDVAIYTDATTLDSYANINDYPGVMRFISAYNVLQPVLWVREVYTNWVHSRYRRNLVLRDWMTTKLAVLRMDMQKMDPASPEYQRQVKLLQAYSDELARLDKKIDAYERS